MTDNQSTLDSSSRTWRFDNLKRWEISVILQTVSSLHIGDGDTIIRPIQESRTKQREVEVNSIITGIDDLPIIPGSTLKGRLRDYLENNVDAKDLVDKVFGWGGDLAEQDRDLGSGGLAEFHDGRWRLSPQKPEESYSYWNNDRKTYIEVSTAINRHSGSALDGSLHYTECVPPGTQFEIIVTGSMEDSHAALIIAALKALGADDRRICLGAGDANGQGHIVQCSEIQVKLLDKTDILGWLKNDSDQQMATSHFRSLGRAEIKELIDNNPCLNEKNVTESRDVFDISLQLDGPFLVNDPAKEGEEDEETNFFPLLDKDGKPRLPVRSFRGAFRAQAERIIRTLGGECCDTGTTGRCGTGEKRCLACELFGGTSWKTTLAIDTFTYCNDEMRPLLQQDFVAIDRFHGGAKDGAKFCASYSYAPKFKSKITIDSRIPEEERSWRRGVLALLFRDLKEGDIYLGFGMNKGYGAIETAEISRSDGRPFADEEDLQAFYDKCKQAQPANSCDDVNEPKAKNATINLPPVTPPPTADLAKFHNPYHFIPIKKPDTSTWYKKEKLASKESPHSHGFYRSETENGKKLYHGRIICKLTSETPFFIGASDAPEEQQIDGEARLKEPYLLNGERAIPATTLRGLLSSLAEAASNSAMRVMENGVVTYRKPMRPPHKVPSALGMVTKRSEGYFLIPLALPTLKEKGGFYKPDNNYNYTKMFPNGRAQLKVYLNNAYNSGVMKDFIDQAETWTSERRQIYYLPLDRVDFKNGGIDANCNCLRHPSRGGGPNTDFLIGQKPKNGISIPTSNQDRTMVPGILRILGKNHRQNDLPNNKKHELFIPVPDEFVTNTDTFLKTHQAYPIPVDVIDNFEKIAAKQTALQKQETIDHDEERLPFHLKGMTRQSDHTLKIKHGDIVYFLPDRDGEKVAEVSFSSIWRGMVGGTLNNLLPDANLLPFNNSREAISPAELLFGFVGNEDDDNKGKHGRGFKGKVRIGPGTLSPQSAQKKDDELLGAEITLKALSTPKPPSPALYFKAKDSVKEHYIRKIELNRSRHEIQGRKVYLHALRDENGKEVRKISAIGDCLRGDRFDYPWVNKIQDSRNHLRVRFTPIQEDNSFFFHLDFNNLTEWEIGLLCYVLRPDENFRHKIGMGKPLGLGSVKIDIGAIQTIDRKKRYLESMQDDKRYNGVGWMDDTLMAEIAKSKAYSPVGDPTGELGPEQCRNKFIATMDADIYRAFELLGNPDSIRHPVHYPQLKNGDIEIENFKWFAENDEKQQKALQPICATTTFLQPLTRYEPS